MVAAQADRLRSRMASAFTLRGLVAELAEPGPGRGLKVDYRTMWKFAHSAGLGCKKTALASEQDRPDVARKRARWKKHQGGIDLKRLVFIDETWAKTNMTPLRGWAARGKRLIGKAPFGHWNTMTFVAALRHDEGHRALGHRSRAMETPLVRVTMARDQWRDIQTLRRAGSGPDPATGRHPCIGTMIPRIIV